MKIIDNNKDYYDFYEGVYGIDEKVVYDRRNSVGYNDFLKDLSFRTPVKNPGKSFEAEINRISVRIGFNIYEFEKDKIPEEEVDVIGLEANLWSGYITGKSWSMPDEVYVESKGGWVQNPRRITREELEGSQDKESQDIPAIEIKMWNDYEHSTPLTDNVVGYDWSVCNPILRDYPVVINYILPETVWQGVYEFITTMSEKKIVDNRTDLEHIESAGFDKKTSFRKDKKKKKR